MFDDYCMFFFARQGHDKEEESQEGWEENRHRVYVYLYI